MKAMIKNYFSYESEEILYDLEKMRKQGFILKNIIQNIYIFEPTRNNFKYFVYKITTYNEFEAFHKELTSDQWILIKSNRNWAIYKTQRQDLDSGYTPIFLKKEVIRNVISELTVFTSLIVGWITYKGNLHLQDNYNIAPKNIPPLFQSIELVGYILFVGALFCLITEIINAHKSQYKTALRLPLTRKLFNFANVLLLGICVYVICIAIMLITESLLHSIIALGLVIYWVSLYVLLGTSLGLVNTLTVIASTTFFILKMLTLWVV